MMFHSQTQFALLVFSIVPLAASGANPLPLGGPILAEFERPAAEQLAGLQSGVFRDDVPPDRQFIEANWGPLAVGKNKPGLGLLTLAYNVSTPNSYNGWYLQLGGADWTRYKEGELVLLLRRLDPRVDKFARTTRLKMPDTPGPSEFKIELKAEDAGGQIRSVGLVQTIGMAQLAQQAKDGYFEHRIPLADFGIELSRLRECVLVLEHGRLAPLNELRGVLGLRALLLTTRRNQTVEEVLYDPDRLLDELGRQCFLWFKKHRHPVTGLVLDRAPNRLDYTPRPDRPAMCSVASVGYYLSLLPEWVRLGYLSHEEAVGEATRVLRFVRSSTAHERGLLFHFVAWDSGKRWGKCEASLLDTAILLNGGMAASSLDASVAGIVNELLDRVEWPAFLGKQAGTGKPLLSFGWTPEKGLLSPADARSSEGMMPYVLAVASKHAIDPQCWYNTVVDQHEYAGFRVLNVQHSLFTSQYGMGWHSMPTTMRPMLAG